MDPRGVDPAARYNLAEGLSDAYGVTTTAALELLTKYGVRYTKKVLDASMRKPWVDALELADAVSLLPRELGPLQQRIEILVGNGVSDWRGYTQGLAAYDSIWTAARNVAQYGVAVAVEAYRRYADEQYDGEHGPLGQVMEMVAALFDNRVPFCRQATAGAELSGDCVEHNVKPGRDEWSEFSTVMGSPNRRAVQERRR